METAALVVVAAAALAAVVDVAAAAAAAAADAAAVPAVQAAEAVEMSGVASAETAEVVGLVEVIEVEAGAFGPQVPLAAAGEAVCSQVSVVLVPSSGLALLLLYADETKEFNIIH